MLTKTLADQLQELHYADSIGIEVNRVELGNEFNNINNPGHVTFPTPLSYANTAAIWRDSIKAHYDTCKVAFIGENRTWSGGQNWNNVMLTKSPDALTWHESPNLNQFYFSGVVNTDSLNAVMLTDFNTKGMNLVTTVPIWVTESNYTYDDLNVMSQANQIITSLTMVQQISGLIDLSNHVDQKMFIIRGIESSKQGAFTIGNSNITKQATAFAMDMWAAILASF
jgi:hypothetical protein